MLKKVSLNKCRVYNLFSSGYLILGKECSVLSFFFYNFINILIILHLFKQHINLDFVF